uniref:DDT domain-containing protein n=2 Tax=Aegilops tauschii subsp. strangulata TaxID=200361 RepID=A0A453R850_AEGTS
MAKKGAGGEESVVVPAQTEQAKQGPPRKRNPCPGIRCVGGRIYDPENGKTCHQCRQKTMDFAVACTQPRKKGLCPIHFCHKCLFNRYGENAEDMTKEAGWTCPKCRGICNCSFCRKKKGETPTGILAHAAKASGHSSVHDLLIKGSDMVVAAQTLSSLPKKIKKERKEGSLKRALGTDDATGGLFAEGDENIKTDLNALPSVPIKKKLKKIKKEHKEGNIKKVPGTGDATDGLLTEGDENTNTDLNAFPSVPTNKELKKIKKEHKKGNIKRALGTDDGTDGLLAQGDDNTGTDLNALLPVPISKKLKKGNHRVNDMTADEKCPVEIKGELHIRNESTDVPGTKIELPIGTPVTDIAGAELEVDDVGSALQFHEFCRTFAEVLKIRKGQPEKVLQVITGGGRIGREVPSVVADLHISLLSVIQEDREENPSDYSRNGDAWIIDTGKYISESTVISKELPVDCLSQGVLGYKKLSPSLKLHVLNFLCDEALSTTTLKNWVLKQHESATERKVAAREKFRAVKEKEKELKEKLTIKMAKPRFLRNGAEINSLVSQIKEAYEDKKAVIDEEKLGGLVRKKPVRIDEGVAYWKLDGYCDKTAIMRQGLSEVIMQYPFMLLIYIVVVSDY